MKLRSVLALGVLLVFASSALAAVPQTMHYQAVLTSGGSPVVDPVSVTFTLYDADVGGNELWTQTRAVIPDSVGLVNVLLGEGASIPDTAFGPADVWLGVQIESDPELSPRAKLSSTPYSFRVGSIEGAAAGGLSGTLTITPGSGKSAASTASQIVLLSAAGDSVILGPPDGTAIRAVDNGGTEWLTITNDPINGAVMGIRDQGGNIRQDNAVKSVYSSGGETKAEVGAGGMVVYGATSSDTLVEIGPNGNVTIHSVSSGIKFGDGTVQFTQAGAANGLPEPGGTMSGPIESINDPYIKMGKANFGSNNTNDGDSAFVAGVDNAASGAVSTISGGQGNITSGVFATVAGGSFNKARGWNSVVAGGGSALEADSNLALGVNSTIGGGRANIAISDVATVAGGSDNIANGSGNTISGGQFNFTDEEWTTVGGGFDNVASIVLSTVGGGGHNKARGVYSVIAGGGGWNEVDSNVALGINATIGGGRENLIGGDYSTIAGGSANTVSGHVSVIGGGAGNSSSGGGATVSGGNDNIASGGGSTVGGGMLNKARGEYATIAGGGGASDTDSNLAFGDYSAVSGGRRNWATGPYASVGGGQDNAADGHSSTVPGGAGSSAVGDYTFAAGRRAKADSSGMFVWGGNRDVDFPTATETNFTPVSNQFLARTEGGVVFVSAVDGSGNSTAGVQLASGGGSWASLSDRNFKENIETVDGAAVLAKIASMPINTWNYRAQDESIRHIGPMAQDFYAAFGVGEDERHITTIDGNGVALAAIQELHKRTERIEALESELKELQKLVQEMLDNQ